MLVLDANIPSSTIEYILSKTRIPVWFECKKQTNMNKQNKTKQNKTKQTEKHKEQTIIHKDKQNKQT